jgi:triacylglycerol lipase
MAFDVNFALQVMLPAADAAYKVMQFPGQLPTLPAGYAIVDTILADAGRAAPQMAVAPPAMQAPAATMLAESDIFGYVAWNDALKTALVSIRGTQTPKDWEDNVDALPVVFIPNPAAGLVHMGFQLVYEHIAANVRILLARCAGIEQLLVTGHSLGGAVAILAAMDIYYNLGYGITPQMYTFAGPRAGAPNFVASVNRGIPVLYRVVNFGDLVPEVPLPPLYLHAGQEVQVHGGFKAFNPAFAHSLTQYGGGLLQLPGVTPGTICQV